MHPGKDTSRRDAGLVRALGLWGLTASIVSMTVGASIFAIPAALAANSGLYSPLVIVVCAVAVGAVAICFAEGGSRIPSSGGAYGYIEAAFGPLTGYVAGTLLWFSAVLACGGIATALADVVVSVLPASYRPVAHTLLIAGCISLIAMVNISGVSRGARLVNTVTVLKLLPLLIFVGAGAGAIHAAYFHAAGSTVGADVGGLGRAVILVLFAFMGMETALCASGEVVDPARTIPRALALALGLVALLYIAIQMVAQGILGPVLSTSVAPLADAMAHLSPSLRLLMLGGAALSMFGYLSSDILGTPRLLFAFARDGLLPRALGRVHPKSHAPHIAIMSYAAIAMILALTGTFAELAVLSALSMAPFYIAGCIGAWILARRDVSTSGSALRFKGINIAMSLGVGSMLVLIGLAARNEILGLLALIAISVAVFFAQTRFTRR